MKKKISELVKGDVIADGTIVIKSYKSEYLQKPVFIVWYLFTDGTSDFGSYQNADQLTVEMKGE